MREGKLSVDDRQLEELTGAWLAREPGVRELLRADLAPATWRAYAGAFRRLEEDLNGRMLTDIELARHCVQLWRRGRAVPSVMMVLAAVRWRMRAQGADPADVIGPRVRRVLRAVRRSAAARGRGQVAGVEWEVVDAGVRVVEATGKLRDVRNAALVAVMSDALLRVSEVRALRGINVEAEGPGTLVVERSKTDPFGRGAVLYLGEPTVRRIRRWQRDAGLDMRMEAPLFQRVRRNGRPYGPLSLQAIRRIVAEVAGHGGAQDGRISGHSLRIGSARSLAARGASVVELQVEGRWKSPVMPQHYVRGQEASRGAVARLRYGKKRNDGED